MNITLADAVIHAVTDPAIVREPGDCQMFAREVLERVYGHKYAPFMRANAKATAQAFLAGGLGLAVSAALPLQFGDMLFKRFITQRNGRPFPFGHVGFWTPKGVGENSSTHLGRVQGAKGYRTLEQFGHFDLVVRLPDPHLVLAHAPAPPMHLPQIAPAPGLHVKVFERATGKQLPAMAEMESGILIVRVG